MIDRLKLRIGSRLNDWLWRIGLQLRPNERLPLLDGLFYRYYREPFYFVQIGANDGRRADQLNKLIRRHRLVGLAVEPLPDMFAELSRTYSDHSQVRLANVAIHRSEKEVTMHRVRRDADVEDWAHGIASLNPRHHLLSGTDPALIVKERVPALSIEELFARFAVGRVDLFLVDAEGYDKEIVTMLLETGHRPKIIAFEHGMIEGTMTRAHYLELHRRLFDCGYFVLTDLGEAIAYLPEYEPAARLRPRVTPERVT